MSAPSATPRSIPDRDVIAPGGRLPPVANALTPLAPHDGEARLGVGVAVAVHVREVEAEAWPGRAWAGSGMW